MCQTPANIFRLNVLQAPAGTHLLPMPTPAQAPEITGGGSRRRRLWELSDHAHCPLVGVCMPMPAIRRLISRYTSQLAKSDDYDLHCLAVSESKRRSLLAESIQKELDQQHAPAIRKAARLKTGEALLQWWQGAVTGPDLAQALWVTLTHPRCSADLEHRVLGHVHMLQHQVGMACRVDQARFDQLLKENAVLSRHVAGAQERCTRMGSDAATRVEAKEVELIRLRAELLSKDTHLAQMREQLHTLQSTLPDLPARLVLSKDKHHLTAQNQQLRRQLQQAAQEIARLKDKLGKISPHPQQAHASDQATERLPPPASQTSSALSNLAVLCVGGRPAIVPIYRQVIQHTGGRFLHHDGGEEDNAAQLEATLAAADLVICQTGCVSHNAYWRVKDHCKRTGKRCVFVETPSRTALTRALDMVSRELDQG
jgi:DNA-binding transcriptional MerR regulator